MELIPHSDQRYIEALLHNNYKGINEVYEVCSPMVERYILNNSGNVEDAKDMMQEGLIIISRQARQKSDFTLTCAFSTYLLMVVKSSWLNHLKKVKRNKVTLVPFSGLTENELLDPVNEEEMSKEQNEKIFNECFEQLPESCRQILKSSWSGKSMEEVSKEFNFSYAYTRKRKCECLEKLVSNIKSKARKA